MAKTKTKTGGNLNSHFLLSSLLPSIKIQVIADNIVNQTIGCFYHYHTSPLGRHSYMCKECGRFFVSKAHNRIQYFCSISCAKKYSIRIKKEKQYKLLFKVIDKKAFAQWFKQYNNIVIGYICNNYDSEWREDLIDSWTDKSMRWYYCCKNKDKPIAFLKTCLHYEFLSLRKNRKEIFYDECNYKTQEQILGSYNDRWG